MTKENTGFTSWRLWTQIIIILFCVAILFFAIWIPLYIIQIFDFHGIDVFLTLGLISFAYGAITFLILAFSGYYGDID